MMHLLKIIFLVFLPWKSSFATQSTVLSFGDTNWRLKPWHRWVEAEGSNWCEKWMNLLDRPDSIPPRERFEEMSPLLLRQQYGFGEDGDLLYLRAQKILIETPGHAEFFRNMIHDACERYDDASLMRSVRLERLSAAFKVLESLPSVETIAVLGEFIHEEENREPKAEEEKGKGEGLSLADWAMMALDELIADRPYIHPYEKMEWRVWCEEVRMGRRTFRFKGDPQEYSLEGPVRLAKDGPSTQRPSKRDAPEGEAVEERATVFTPGRMIFTGMAALLCLWAWWRYGKMGPKRAV